MWRDAYSRIVGPFNGHKALVQAAEQNRLERFFTFPNFAASADRCGQELRAAGLSEVTVERFSADGTTTWYGWKSMKAWGVATEDPEDERRYRELLYRHNLDLLFHRLLYWADGQRSLLDIVDRLEFERDELQRDTSISRTSSGLAIVESCSPQLDVAAVLALVERIVASGYLKVREKCPAA